MKSIQRILGIAVMACFITPLLWAQQATVSPEMTKTFRLLGTWSGKPTMKMGQAQPMPVNFTVKVSKTAGGFGMRGEGSVKGPSGMHIAEEDLFGYDPQNSMMHMMSVDNTGLVRDRAGTWVDDSTMTLKWEGTVNGTKAHEVFTIHIDAPRRVTFHDEEFHGDTSAVVFTGTLKKK